MKDNAVMNFLLVLVGLVFQTLTAGHLLEFGLPWLGIPAKPVGFWQALLFLIVVRSAILPYTASDDKDQEVNGVMYALSAALAFMVIYAIV